MIDISAKCDGCGKEHSIDFAQIRYGIEAVATAHAWRHTALSVATRNGSVHLMVIPNRADYVAVCVDCLDKVMAIHKAMGFCLPAYLSAPSGGKWAVEKEGTK